MKTITYQTEDFNRNLPAGKQNNIAFNESVSDGSILISSDEEEQLHAADKCNAKIHYLSRTIAREHGIIPSAILTGFAYKLKFHRKNKWKDRWWYYDPIEVLRTHRWPYLSDGCICETIEYLEEKKLLIKDCNNKLSYDRTTWYSLDDEVRNTALSDLVWFDVAVTRKLKSIHAGLIYHNLRFHLREVLKQDPECQVPYHKLNKAMLARVLPMSESTAKRWVNELVNQKLLLRHPTKRNLYTVADVREYHEIGSSTNAIGSSANAIGSSTNGSSANAIRSSANVNGSKVNANGSTANDNTQCETNEKPFTNQSQKDACVTCDDFSSDDKANHANYLDHQSISDTVSSAPLGGREGTDTESPHDADLLINWNTFRSFDELIQQNQETEASWDVLDDRIKSFVHDLGTDLASYFAKAVLSTNIVQEVWDTTNRDQLIHVLRQPFAEYTLQEIMAYQNQPLNSDQLTKLVFAPNFETFIRAFAADEVWSGKHSHSMSDKRSEVRETHIALVEKLETELSFTPSIKCKLFKQAIAQRNRYGWLLNDDLRWKNLVQPNTKGFKKITDLFGKHPELNVEHLLTALSACLNVIHSENIPEGFDKHWATRQGDNLVKFAQQLESIVAELGMFAECPVGTST